MVSGASNQIHLDENPFLAHKFSKFSDIVKAGERVQGDTSPDHVLKPGQ